MKKYYYMFTNELDDYGSFNGNIRISVFEIVNNELIQVLTFYEYEEDEDDNVDIEDSIRNEMYEVSIDYELVMIY